MARDLNWFQARKLARVDGVRVRRQAWRKWLEFDRAVFLWFIFQPAGVEIAGAEGVPTLTKQSRRVVEGAHDGLDSQFGSGEFLANDWTDEDWNLPPNPPPDPDGDDDDDDGDEDGGGGDNDGGDENDGGDGSGDGNGGDGDDGGGGDDSTGGGGGSDSGGSGNFGGGGGGSGGGGGGGDAKPPKPKPPAPNYTPVVTVLLDPNVDGPECFIVSPRPCAVLVSFTIPNPPGGTLRAGLTSATCMGQFKIVANGGPGGGGAVEFLVHVTAQQVVTATVTFSAGDGVHTWTGVGTATVAEKDCLLVGYEWSGNEDVTHNCDPSGYEGEETGYTRNDHYSAIRTYAVKPEEGEQTGVAYGPNGNLPHNRRQTLTDTVSGDVTTNDLYVPAPETIVATVNAGLEITHVEPGLLGIFPDDYDSGPVEDGICVTTTTSQESGPNG